MAGRVDSSTLAAAIVKVGEAAKFAPAFRAHLEEILLGPAFKGSVRSQDFLRHVVERALSGQFEDLHERNIGIDLFGKPASYDTSEDAIVRVTASDVRKRLLQHYGMAGAESEYRIGLPSGSYLPDFQLPASSGSAEAAGKEALREQSAASGSATAEPIPPPLRSLLVWNLKSRVPVALVVVLVVAAGIAGWAIAKLSGERPWPSNDPIVAAFHGTTQPIQVIVSDEAFVLVQALMRHNFSLQDYENRSYLSLPGLEISDAVQRLQKLISTRQIGNMGDLQNAVRVSEKLRARNFQVLIRHARQFDARDFRSGSFVILGSSFSNPWADLFQNHETNFPLEESTPPGKVPSYLNRRPLAGEPAQFGVSPGKNGAKTITHARVSLVDNSFHTGRILLVAGQSLSATELAGEYLFQSELLRKIRQQFKLADDVQLPSLEMILRVTELNQVGDSVELVACRRLNNSE